MFSPKSVAFEKHLKYRKPTLTDELTSGVVEL
jgi:hypothetical protein